MQHIRKLKHAKMSTPIAKDLFALPKGTFLISSFGFRKKLILAHLFVLEKTFSASFQPYLTQKN